jgi:hypothetical protein
LHKENLRRKILKNILAKRLLHIEVDGRNYRK